MQALAIMYHDVVENGDFESSGFPGEGAHVYKLRREDFERHLEAIAGATAAVGTVNQLEGRPVLLTFDDGGVQLPSPHRRYAGRPRLARPFLHHHRPYRHRRDFWPKPSCASSIAAATSSAATPVRIPHEWRH